MLTFGRVSADALASLLDHGWPGNVRELAHTVQRVVVLGRSEMASREDLPQAIWQSTPEDPKAFRQVISVCDLHHEYAIWAMDQCGGQKGRTPAHCDACGFRFIPRIP